MKYMGSKRAMLRNGLGEALESAAETSHRVVDLFTGSGAVAWHAAEKFNLPVIAGDLQMFATDLAGAVITRARKSNVDSWWGVWSTEAEALLLECESWAAAIRLQSNLSTLSPADAAREARAIADASSEVVCRAYGGHYFSPWQALWLDVLRRTLPPKPEHRAIAMGALIQAASRCAASPGHTAQPFKANDTAGPYLLEAWRRDLPSYVRDEAVALGKRHARQKGQVICNDALAVAKRVKENDLVFLDPPYSGVHYSRFYHVLETVARGEVGAISGVGRYPPPDERPSSDFSLKTKAEKALSDLFSTISRNGGSAIVTFPAEQASNGLSGNRVREVADQYFQIRQEKVSARFSTMGGDTKHRAARHDTHELILTLRPR